MMNLNDFVDLRKVFRRTYIAGGATEGRTTVTEEQVASDTSRVGVRPLQGISYAEVYAKQEREYINQTTQEEVPASKGLGDVDDNTSIGGSVLKAQQSHITLEELTSVYSEYDFSTKMKLTLPITSSQTRILHVMESNQTMILQGATGCGKSTQVAQYVLDYSKEKNLPCNIVVTQPRRIAAISLAKRVCQERNWQLGDLVGYQVGLDNKHMSDNTRLLYCTTGVLLQKLIAEKHLTTYTHIILDEVHERTQDMDFLFIIIRRYLATNSKMVKVMLMSATFDVNHFSKYFTYPLATKEIVCAPIVQLKKEESPFSVQTFYFERLKEIINPLPVIRYDEPGISTLGYTVAVKLIKAFDQIEQSNTQKTRGAVLVFLPGIHEIEELFNMLMEKEIDYKWWIKPLHSTITSQEQELVFKRPPEGFRKIILSTNIAESSITVPDITFVVDFILTKQMMCDPNTNFQSLQLTWTSKNSCIQRAGRAGRVAAGRVFRLCPEEFFRGLPTDSVPEMQRGSLERTILSTKLLEMGEPQAVLALAMDPPDLTRIEQTVLMLKEKGALLHTSNGKYSRTDGDITFLGQVMAKLPVDPVISKLIVLGHVFSVLPECIIMGAAMSLKSLFSTPFQERLEAYHSKLAWADSSCSDCISFLNAYTVWEKNKEIGYFDRSVGAGEKGWARRYHIQLQTMHEVHQLVQDIHLRLKRLNVEVPVGAGRVQLTPEEKPLILKIVLAGAFFPNYFVRGSEGGQVSERDAVKLLDGRDPYSSVYLMGMPPDQPRQLYAKRIRDALAECSPDVRVSFDNSSKVYVHFDQHQNPGHTFNDRCYQPTIPGKVIMGVYRAIKMRQLRIPIVIPLLRLDEARKRAKELNLPTDNSMPLTFGRPSIEDKPQSIKPRLPGISTTVIQLIISYVIDAGHFWGQCSDVASVEQQTFMYNVLRNSDYLVPLKEKPKVNHIYAAMYKDDSNHVQWYRAQVEKIQNSRDQKKAVYHVFFLDYGNRGTVFEDGIMYFNNDLLQQGILEVPAQAFECMLAKVQPCAVSNDTGLWTQQATKVFKDMTNTQYCYGSIYSVVNGVVHLELIVAQSRVNINKWLIDQRYADEAVESFMSQENNKIRQQPLEPGQQKHYEQLQERKDKGPSCAIMVEPPTETECRSKVVLRGPRSPLEMRVYSLMRNGMGRDVVVDWESVNSVLIDTDPQDPHDRLLVAASIGENPGQDRLSLRHTTLMPNIHGLSALICLIFAPCVEFRTNADRTQYTGALCGLGRERNSTKSIFPDHDMEINFDTEILPEDIADINRLRLWMNECLVPEDVDECVVASNIVRPFQGKVKVSLFELLRRTHTSVEVHHSTTPLCWGRVNPKFLCTPTHDKDTIHKQKRAIFPLHWSIRLKLSPATRAHYQKLLDNVETLKQISAGMLDATEATCDVCKIALDKRSGIRAHLATQLHRTNERDLRFTVDADE